MSKKTTLETLESIEGLLTEASDLIQTLRPSVAQLLSRDLPFRYRGLTPLQTVNHGLNLILHLHRMVQLTIKSSELAEATKDEEGTS